VAYVGLAYYAKEVYNWPFKRFLLAFASSFLPLGPFFFDGRLKIEEKKGLKQACTKNSLIL